MLYNPQGDLDPHDACQHFGYLLEEQSYLVHLVTDVRLDEVGSLQFVAPNL